MHDLSADTLTQAILGVSVLMGLVIVGVLIVQSFRGGMKHSGPTTGQMLANFEEMRSRGDISDADYRKIKSVLGAELHGELKDDKDKA